MTATAVRHTSKVRARVVELHEAGWPPKRIVELLQGEGVDPCPNTATVWRWTKPEKYEAQVAARRGRGPYTFAWPGYCSQEWKLQRMRALRETGISYAAVAAVMSLDFPADPVMSEYVVRTKLNSMAMSA